MNPIAKKLLDAAMRLPHAERQALADRLFDSLDSDEPNVEAAWLEETERRVTEMDRGVVELLPWKQIRNTIFALPRN